MGMLLADYAKKLETALNGDQELRRRVRGFKTFAGCPDGHYLRARQQGPGAQARAVRCYPFGGESLLRDGQLIGISIRENEKNNRIVIARAGAGFSVAVRAWEAPRLTISLSKELFKKTVLGRHRWVWVLGMDEVAVTWCEGLPHSDWITLLELLVVMQELVECDAGLLHTIENW